MEPPDETRRKGPLGIFDSGIGGLSVWKEIRLLLPDEDIVYLADTANCPYGPQEAAQIIEFSFQAVETLLSRGAKIIVVACNTASTTSLKVLREHYREIPIIGMVPAVKPAALTTRNKKIGVLATQTTARSEPFQELIKAFTEGVDVTTVVPEGLVEAIEQGKIESKETKEFLEQSLKPMIRAGVDTIVLGCTHFPFVGKLIKEIMGSDVVLIDSGPAVARRTAWVLTEAGLRRYEPTHNGQTIYLTTGDREKVQEAIHLLLGFDPEVERVNWSFSLKQK